MGCFSFMCKECGKPILSDSLKGQQVKLFLLENGKVIEQMEGGYNSYGAVFGTNWNMEWTDVCELMFGNHKSGIAAVHTRCWTGKIPTTDSDQDPNQGWGEPETEEERY